MKISTTATVIFRCLPIRLRLSKYFSVCGSQTTLENKSLRSLCSLYSASISSRCPQSSSKNQALILSHAITRHHSTLLTNRINAADTISTAATTITATMETRQQPCMFPNSGPNPLRTTTRLQWLLLASIGLGITLIFPLCCPNENPILSMVFVVSWLPLLWILCNAYNRYKQIEKREESVRNGDLSIYDETCDLCDDVSAVFAQSPVLQKLVNQAAPTTTATAEQCGQCVVCLENVNVGQQIRTLPCQHILHSRCADLWLVQTCRNSCPTCSATVVPDRDADMRVK